MVVCNFDIQLTFACAGWEDIAHDTRVFQSMGHKEVFNHMHSSLGASLDVWKKRWTFLREMPNYLFNKQVKIVIATIALHNYIRRYSKCDYHFDDPMTFVKRVVEGSHEKEAL